MRYMQCGEKENKIILFSVAKLENGKIIFEP